MGVDTNDTTIANTIVPATAYAHNGIFILRAIYTYLILLLNVAHVSLVDHRTSGCGTLAVGSDGIQLANGLVAPILGHCLVNDFVANCGGFGVTVSQRNEVTATQRTDAQHPLDGAPATLRPTVLDTGRLYTRALASSVSDTTNLACRTGRRPAKFDRSSIIVVHFILVQHSFALRTLHNPVQQVWFATSRSRRQKEGQASKATTPTFI
jgi:hypothetical protein